jgi:signal transduction histidine kinase
MESRCVPGSRFWALLAVAIVLAPSPALAQSATKAPRILLMHATDLLTPSTIEQDAITRKAISEAWPTPVEFYSVGFDEIRSLGPSIEADLVNVLLEQFSERPPDLIVFHGLMHDMYARYRTSLWPGVPVMFSGVAAHRLGDPPFSTGMPTSAITFDLPGTVDLALQLQPEAKRLLLIVGTSTYDRLWQELAPRQLAGYRKRLEIELSGGRSLGELKELVAGLKSDTIVVFLSMYRDGSDRVYTHRQVTRELSESSRVPIYAINPYRIGDGVVGGSVNNWAGQEKTIGDIARRLLSGEPASSITRAPPVPAVCRIDWRRIGHWNIPARRIPENCEILFREPPFWVRYRTEAILIALIVLLQATVIALLLRQRHVRRQALVQAERQRVELTHASRLSMVGELSASIAHEINQPLSAIHMNASVGEDMLDTPNPRLTELKEILGDIRRDDERASEVIKRLRELLQKRPVEMRRIDINETLNGVLQLLSVTARHRDMFIRTELGVGLKQVHGDRVQLQQVVMNLVMNAIEAMSDSPPERRTVTVSTMERPEGWIEVSVSDGGHGVAPDAVSSLFDPFFTTKQQGMGLGLSISRTIVQAHRGRIWVETKPDGATFRFVIPVLDEAVPPSGTALQS